MTRTLQNIKDEREEKKSNQKKRQRYKEAGIEVPIRLWSSQQMLDYFLEKKIKKHMTLIEVRDKRSRFTIMAAINRLGMNGEQFVNMVNWVEATEGISTVWHLIKKAPEYKKNNKKLFEGGDEGE